MEKWEYKMLIPEVNGFLKRKLDSGFEDDLNTLGNEGWELISVAPMASVAGWGSQTTGIAFIFKRKQ